MERREGDQRSFLPKPVLRLQSDQISQGEGEQEQQPDLSDDSEPGELPPEKAIQTDSPIEGVSGPVSNPGFVNPDMVNPDLVNPELNDPESSDGGSIPGEFDGLDEPAD